MKYYKTELNQIFAFEDDFDGVPEELISVTELEAMLIVNPPLTDAELLEQAKSEKWSNANSQIEKLKIGYLSGSTFVAKFGYEIDGYPADDAQLYDVTAAPTLVDVNAHIYKASKDGLRAMADKAALLAPETTVNWYEDWQTFTTDKVCLDVVAARTTKEHQLILDAVVGV